MTIETPQRPAVVRPAAEARRFSYAGVTVTLLAAAAETGGRFSVIEYISPPTGVGPALHLHREMEESFHVLKSTGELSARRGRIQASAGTFVHVTAGGRTRSGTRAPPPRGW